MFELVFEDQIFTEKTILENRDVALTSWQKEIIDSAHTFLKNQTEIILKSSGSSGPAKDVSFSRDQITASSLLTKETFNLSASDSILLCLPQKYVAGRMMLYRAIINQWRVIAIEPKIELKIDFDLKIDFAAMVPMQVESLLRSNPEKFLTIKQLIIGGASVNQNLYSLLQSISTRCYETYGMTETLTHIAIKELNGKHKTKNFRALKGVQLRQDSDESLIIDASHIGISNLKTNDIVKFHDFNQFEILGRKDRIINSGGIKLNPESIEKKIENFIDRPFFIDKRPDIQLGERIVLIIEGEKLHEISLGLLRNMMSENLSKIETPKEIIFKDQFMRTSSGKIKYGI